MIRDKNRVVEVRRKGRTVDGDQTREEESTHVMTSTVRLQRNGTGNSVQTNQGVSLILLGELYIQGGTARTTLEVTSLAGRVTLDVRLQEGDYLYWGHNRDYWSESETRSVCPKDRKSPVQPEYTEPGKRVRQETDPTRNDPRSYQSLR